MSFDWLEIARIGPGIVGAVTGIAGAVTGGLALYFNRRDARRLTEASKPRASLQINREPETDGWFLIKLTFENVSQSLVIDKVKLVSPAGKIARRKKVDGAQTRDGEGERTIDVVWRLDTPRSAGQPAGFAHLNIRLKSDVAPTSVMLLMKGHYTSGLQTGLSIACAGQL
jgi:hypothetical protein